MTDDVRRLAHSVLLAAFNGTNVPGWLGSAFEDGLGGICLYGNNMAAGSDLATLAREVRALEPTAVLTLDEEGGDVTRLHASTGSPHPGNAALGRYDDVETTRTVAAGIGAELARAGIWLNLAPVADINSNPRNPVIGTRSFGSEPSLVARHTVAFVEGLASQGVASSVKHFPGHGDTATDSHISLPRVTAPVDVVRERELGPFRAVVDSGAATIMTSHVVLDAFDADQPATLSSPVLTGLLRDELGFEGVIISDALDMAGASAIHGIGGAAVRSLSAGADLLCLGPEPSTEPHMIAEAVHAICAAVDSGDLKLERLQRAAQRVAELRASWSALLPRPDADHVIAESRAASQRVATELASSAPAFDGPATVIRIDIGTNPAIGASTWGRLNLGGDTFDLTAVDIETAPLVGGRVAIVVRRATAQPDVWEWIQRHLADNPASLLVELGWPDPALDAHERVVCSWGSATVLTDALAETLRGRS